MQGVEYYSNVIKELLLRNVTPVVTLYHWDLPSKLQRLGGWANPTIVTWYTDYAKIVFNKFSDKVKHWVTFNDPKAICYGGYGSEITAPFLNMSGIGEYLCSRNVLLAHANVYHLYDEHYRKLHNGTVGISINFVWYEPASDTMDDYSAAVDARQFEWGQYAHPIFSKGGDYPQEIKKNIAYKSAEQGFARSRLAQLTAKDVLFIRGSADFLGVNTYTTKLAYRDASLEGMYAVPSFMDDMGAVLVKDPTWTQSQSSWLQEVPWGFFKLLVEIKKLYDNPPVYVLENGWSTEGGLLDEDRINYLRTYLNALLDALDVGCDVKGYSVWSLIDSFEWKQGYLDKYGLYEVDFSSPDKTRTPRKSAFIYKEIAKSKTLDPHFEPEKFIVEAVVEVNQDSQEKEKLENDVS
ncbi:unnamed protein product [Chrysodeixis includens]|uniref:Glycosyl hydrolase n=1 Tax=Chrysodeixis includens TaxID=689277 RepID=A0A9P0BX04_CHRIL|nr:unnamed protein product [Chrysodeixis includens]